MTDPTTDAAKLLPCPFCGCHPHTESTGVEVMPWGVHCPNGLCATGGLILAYAATEDAAVNLWNERFVEEECEAGVMHYEAPEQNTRPQPAPPTGEPDEDRKRNAFVRDVALGTMVRLVANYESQADQIADSDLDNEQSVAITWRGQLGDIRNARTAISFMREGVSGLAARPKVEDAEYATQDDVERALLREHEFRVAAEVKLAEREAELAEAAVHLDHEMRHRFIPLTNRPTSRTEITEWLERHAARQQQKASGDG